MESCSCYEHDKGQMQNSFLKSFIPFPIAKNDISTVSTTEAHIFGLPVGDSSVLTTWNKFEIISCVVQKGHITKLQCVRIFCWRQSGRSLLLLSWLPDRVDICAYTWFTAATCPPNLLTNGESQRLHGGSQSANNALRWFYGWLFARDPHHLVIVSGGFLNFEVVKHSCKVMPTHIPLYCSICSFSNAWGLGSCRIAPLPQNPNLTLEALTARWKYDSWPYFVVFCGCTNLLTIPIDYITSWSITLLY